MGQALELHLCVPKSFLAGVRTGLVRGENLAPLNYVALQEDVAMRTKDLDLMEVTDSDLIGYFRPHDIANDIALPVSRRRALLAYWASDIHAVAGSPALRSYNFGAAVSIDEIFDALKSLDDEFDLPPAGRPVPNGITA